MLASFSLAGTRRDDTHKIAPMPHVARDFIDDETTEARNKLANEVSFRVAFQTRFFLKKKSTTNPPPPLLLADHSGSGKC